MSTQTIISLDHVSAGYADKTVFNDVSVSIDEHDYIGIIGPNGGGKTTLVKLLLGLIRPQQGTITYWREGRKVENLTMGYLPQYNTIDRKFPISVQEVVLTGLNHDLPLHGSYSQEQRTKVEEVLRTLGIEHLRDSHIGTLSGGQMQRVLIGRAIVSKPDIVILDEPNTFVDKVLQQQMHQLLTTINQDCAVVVVSHDIRAVEEHAHRVLLVNHDIVNRTPQTLTAADIDRCFRRS